MKKIIVTILVMVMLIMLLPGCVSRQGYDALMVEYDGLRARVESVQNELVDTRSQVQTLQGDLVTEQNKSTKLESDLTSAQAKASELASSLEGTKGELGAAQAKNSELTTSLKKSQGELAGIKTEMETLEQANTKLKKLTFWVTALSSEEPESLEVKPKSDNTFKTNETVIVYGRVIGFKHNVVDEELEVHIGVSINIVNAAGKVVESQIWVDSETLERPWAFYWFWWDFQRLEDGRYTAEVEVTDYNSDETVTWKEEFQVGATQPI